MNSKHPQYDGVGGLYDLPWGDDHVYTNISAHTRVAWQVDGPILELGAGTGKECIELAARGLHLVGLELSPQTATLPVSKVEARLSKPQRALLEIVVGDTIRE
jgi:SAM-dependent methyltransferase